MKIFKLTALFLFLASISLKAQTQYRCMLQMNAYKGERLFGSRC
jgi:hypothetical protein